MTALTGAWWLSQAVTGGLLLSIVFRGLARHYPYLTIMLAAQVLRSALLTALTAGPASSSYGRLWLTTEPLLDTTRFLAALEAYRLLAFGFTRMGLWMAIIPATAGGLGAAAVWLTWGTPALDAAYGSLVAAARAFWTLLACAMALSGWWLARLPIRDRAARRHAAIFIVYAVSQAIPFAAAHLLGRGWLLQPLVTAALVGAVGAQAAWAILLERPDTARPERDEIAAAALNKEAAQLMRAIALNRAGQTETKAPLDETD